MTPFRLPRFALSISSHSSGKKESCLYTLFTTYVETPYVFTNGRVFIRETSTQHGRKLRVDALLRAEASLPIAVVQYAARI